jgi:SAM-dependent methyltransferase
MKRVNQEKLKQIAQNRLPTFVNKWLKNQWHIYKHHPPIGRVNWGSLRCLTPIGKRWNERGKPLDRYYIEKFLAEHAEDIRGKVLEIGDRTYTEKFGGDRVLSSDVLHVREGNPNATIVDDLAVGENIPANTFDCLILTQTLQYIYDVRGALKTIYRLLKPGGVVLATLPNLTPLIDPVKDESWGTFCWYWGFTSVSAQKLFEEVFSPDRITLQTDGNVLVATAFLQGLSTRELRPEELDYNDSSYPVLITVRAVKPEVTS